MGMKNNKKLPFLDALARITANATIEMSAYRKPTHTDQILSFRPNHPKVHKLSRVRTLYNRAKTLQHNGTANWRKNSFSRCFDETAIQETV